MNETSSFFNICRICATESPHMVNIFVMRNDGVSIANMISACAQLPIQLNKNRPTNICGQCITNLYNSYDFYCLAQKSEFKFQQIASASEIEQIDDRRVKLEPEIDVDSEENGDCTVFVSEFSVNVKMEEGENELLETSATDGGFQVRSDDDYDNNDGGNVHNFLAKVKKSEKKKKPKKERNSKQPTNNTKYLAKVNATFECHKCHQLPITYAALRKHIKEHAEATAHKCKICELHFSTAQYEQHICKGDSVQCEYCYEIFASIPAVIQHLKGQTCQQKRYKCPKCTRHFNMKYFMECHLELHKNDKLFICDICKKEFRKERQLNLHKKDQHVDESFLCSLCGMNLKTKISYQRHIHRHTLTKSIPCPHCNSKFYDKRDLSNHMDVHANIKYNCDLCPSILSTKHSLAEHKSKKFNILLTIVSFFLISLLFNIAGRIHRNRLDKPQIICEVCSIPLKSNWNLKRHMLTHTGERRNLSYFIHIFLSNSIQ